MRSTSRRRQLPDPHVAGGRRARRRRRRLDLAGTCCGPARPTGFGGKVRALPPDAVPETGVSRCPPARGVPRAGQRRGRALSQKCTHLGCRVPFCESSGQFECPCHGSMFNRAGEYRAGPAPRGMDQLPDRGRRRRPDLHRHRDRPMEGPTPGGESIDEPPTGPSCTEETPLDDRYEYETDEELEASTNRWMVGRRGAAHRDGARVPVLPVVSSRAPGTRHVRPRQRRSRPKGEQHLAVQLRVVPRPRRRGRHRTGAQLRAVPAVGHRRADPQP